MSCPPRTKVVLQGRPVSPRVVVFSLIIALVRARHLQTPTAVGIAGNLADLPNSWQEARMAVLEKWRTPQELFASIGEPESLEAEADFLIGWRPLPVHATFNPSICGNPRLCAGVLARCAGTLYLSRRSPDFTWERLLDVPVAFDDPLVAAV